MPADIYGSKKLLQKALNKRYKNTSIPKGTKEQAFGTFDSLNLKDVKTIQTTKGGNATKWVEYQMVEQ